MGPRGLRYEVLEGMPGAEKAMALRLEVFVGEQKVPREIEQDEQDGQAIHILVFDGEAVVATGRMVIHGESGKIGRMAVSKEQRGTGLGSAVLERLIGEAGRRGLASVHLSSQCHASGFYEKHGFRPVSGVFLEAGIEHVEMERALR